MDIHTMLMWFNRTHYIHIPKDYWDISNFRSTLGHKVNHSFLFPKTKYGFAYNPRFGYIRTVVAKSNITKGEEVLVDYGYSRRSRVPLWYSDLYLKEMGDQWYKRK